MLIQAGKFYRNGLGEVIGPMIRKNQDPVYRFAGAKLGSTKVQSYTDGGMLAACIPSQLDLKKEVPAPKGHLKFGSAKAFMEAAQSAGKAATQAGSNFEALSQIFEASSKGVGVLTLKKLQDAKAMLMGIAEQIDPEEDDSEAMDSGEMPDDSEEIPSDELPAGIAAQPRRKLGGFPEPDPDAKVLSATSAQAKTPLLGLPSVRLNALASVLDHNGLTPAAAASYAEVLRAIAMDATFYESLAKEKQPRK